MFEKCTFPNIDILEVHDDSILLNQKLYYRHNYMPKHTRGNRNVLGKYKYSYTHHKTSEEQQLSNRTYDNTKNMLSVANSSQLKFY